MARAGLLGRTPLRVKLVAAVLALVAAALVGITVASTLALRSYLTNRIDEQLADVVRELSGREQPVESGTPRPVLRSEFLLDYRTTGPPPYRVIAYDLRYSLDDLPPLPASYEEAQRLAGEPYTVGATGGGSRWRLAVTVFGDGSVLIVGQNMANVDSAVNRLIWTEVVIGAVVLILLAAAGVAVVRTSLRPLHEIEQTAGAIAAGDLTRRVPEPEPGSAPPRTELGRLARALNAMLAQIEAAFAARAASEERMRRFVADASHELRTPLTIIRGFAELYRQGAAGSPEEASALVRRIEDEASRMGLLVEDLLLLARLDRERPLELAAVELPVVVADAVHAARAVDPDRTIALEVRADGVPLVVQGDDARLRQVVGNLVSNGLTHTPAGSAVTVRLRPEPGYGVIEVADQGSGLAPEQAERVFERFYRGDTARSRPGGTGGTGGTNGAGASSGGGTGLGLAIVAALVAAHRGTVEVESVPGEGATFRVRLPLDPEAGTGKSQGGSRPDEG